MKDLKIMTTLVYGCAAGVVLSFAGGLYTAVRDHREASKPAPSVFPVPAGEGAPAAAAAPRADGGMPTPAQ